MNKKFVLLLLIILLAACNVAGSESQIAVDGGGETAVTTSNEAESAETARPAGWSEATHSNDADPNYEVVFPEDEVLRLDITIDSENWAAMLADLTELLGEQGTGQGPGGGNAGDGNLAGLPADFQPPADGEFQPPDAGEFQPPERPAGGQGGPGGGQPGGFGGGVPGDFTSENPMWAEATITFEGNTWTHVGVRFKGNSSLSGAWSSGSLELPFKLDFDEFEDDYPEIDNQRFYGFKQLSLSNNTRDASFLRDTVTADILEDAGLASAKTSFVELYVDYGEGPVSFGLYTMIEVIDDTVVDRVFGSDDGNIYEADGTAVSLAEGTLASIPDSFQKENNEDEADWSDIEALYTVLHSDLRQSDPAAWQAELEAVFDVDTFLHWLAINTVIENWDTYGGAAHNYYLYNDLATGQLTWIPWDHNEALKSGGRSQMTLEMTAIGDNWPLIRYLLDNPDYYETYVNYVDETIHTVFEPEAMTARYEELAALIEPYAVADVGQAAFDQAIQELISHTNNRVAAAEAFLGQ
ncbi:MAG: CotH kinase family protein [Ardenticatenaceae bacterium]|nr:CotH kinase family protein [Ardenticatenaceae bacterium]